MNDVELPLEAEEFLVWLSSERGRARNTIDAYRRDLVAYQRWLTQRGLTITTVATDDLIDLVAELRSSGAATTSVARRLAAIRMTHASCECSGTWLCTKTVATSGSSPTANSIAPSLIDASPTTPGASVTVNACRSTMPWKTSFSCCPDTQFRSAPR